MITQDGIPISVFHVSEEDAGITAPVPLVSYAALIMDLVLKTNIMLKQHLGKGEETLKFIRLRTKKGIEIIVTYCNGFLLVVLQDCTEVADVKPKEQKIEGDTSN